MENQRSVGEDDSEAYIYQPTDSDHEDFEKFRQGCLFHNYQRLGSWDIIKQIVRSKLIVSFLVFKPFNSNYDSKYDGLEHVRKKIGKEYQFLIITREIKATKVHYNVLVVSENSFMYLNERKTSRYMISCQDVNNDISNVSRVHEYIIKESQERLFHAIQSPIDLYVSERVDRAVKRHYNKKHPHRPCQISGIIL